MLKWFRNCKRTAEDAKELYRDLVKKYHTDNGGSGDEIKEINAEFQQFWKEVKSIHRTAAGEKKESEQAEKEFKYRECDINAFMEIINKLVIVPGIEIEICGSWLWLTGNTYAYKDYLKSIGCRWSKGKKKWYWTEAPFKNNYHHPSMAAIRIMYGSTVIKSDRELNRQIPG